jgi:hypothetical protein
MALLGSCVIANTLKHSPHDTWWILYLNEVDKMLEKAKEVTREGTYTHIEYARFADDLVVLVDCYRRWDWLFHAAHRRLLEELAELDLQVNAEKTRLIDLNREGESFGFLGFEFRKARTLRGRQGVRVTPQMKERISLLQRLKDIFRRFQSQPVDRVIELLNPVLRGWVHYFRSHPINGANAIIRCKKAGSPTFFFCPLSSGFPCILAFLTFCQRW